MTSLPVFIAALLLVLFNMASCSDVEYHDYIVVGAGPGGLQIGFFLDRAGLDYVIMEKAAMAGNFFSIYPRHGQLISINKRHTGKTNVEFNLRHDWNSLLSTTDNIPRQRRSSGHVANASTSGKDELTRFGAYSKLMFPPREALSRYLNDFAKNASLRIYYETEVGNIEQLQAAATSSADNMRTKGDDDDDSKARRRLMVPRYRLNDQRGKVYHCHTLIVATGMWRPNMPAIVGDEYIEGYESISLNPDDYEGQSVLILGRGNSAFELARSLYGSTNLIHMIGRSRVRLSWSTHYVGDLRAINNELLDTYQLKSLDAILEAPVEMMEIRRRNGKYYIQVREGHVYANGTTATTGNDTATSAAAEDGDNAVRRFVMHDNFAVREPYDRVIRCLGFRFNDSIFNGSMSLTRPKGLTAKYPKIDHGYESVDFPGLYFVGTATHSLDFRKSAGGFIHGFRYTARALHRLLQWKNHGLRWPTSTGSVLNLVTAIVKRINEASGTYQMYRMLGDVILLRGKAYEYIEEFPLNLLHELPQRTGISLNEEFDGNLQKLAPVDGILVVSLEYGLNFSRPDQDVFRLDRATGEPSHAHQSNFLHPVFYYYRKLPTAFDMRRRCKKNWPILPRPDRIHHVVEDFLTSWDAPLSHILPLRRFIEASIDGGQGVDLRSYFVDTCMTLALTHLTVPQSCEEYFQSGFGLDRPPLPQSQSSSSTLPSMLSQSPMFGSETESQLMNSASSSSTNLSSLMSEAGKNELDNAAAAPISPVNVKVEDSASVVN